MHENTIALPLAAHLADLKNRVPLKVAAGMQDALRALFMTRNPGYLAPTEAFREGLAIWPSTFFLFILSAAAVGPSFLILTTRMVEKLSRKTLVRPRVYQLLARISGLLLAVYVLAKSVDTLIWINRTSPGSGSSGYAPEQITAFRCFAGARSNCGARCASVISAVARESVR